MKSRPRPEPPPQAPPTPPAPSRAFLSDILLLALVFALVFLVNFDVLRLVWQDWCDLPILTKLWASGWEGRWKIVSNAWVSQPRVFFLSLLAKGALGQWAGLSAAPYLLMNLGAHLLTVLIVYRLVRRASGARDVSLAAALLALLAPTGAAAVFAIANGFYVFSFCCVALFLHLYAFPLPRGPADLAALTIAALAAQFMGDQTLPVLYLAFAGGAAWTLAKREKVELRYELCRSCLPAAACLATLIPYSLACVRKYSSSLPLHWSAAEALRHLNAFAKLHFDSWRFGSQAYGAASVPVSWGTLCLLALVVAFAVPRLKRAIDEAREGAVLGAGPAAVLLAGAWLALFVPVLVTNLAGFRLAEFRHLYGSGILLAVAVAIGADGALRRLAAGPRTRLALLSIVIAYGAGLTLYDLREVWGTQAALDRRIWAAIDEEFRPEIRYIVTDSLQVATLFPVDSSNAISDFHEDFPVYCRVEAVYGKTVRVTRRYREQDDRGGRVMLRGYRGAVWEAEKSTVLPILLRYKLVDQALANRLFDLTQARLRVFGNFADYQRARKAEDIPWNSATY